MIRFLKQHKLMSIAIFLCAIMMAGFCISPVATKMYAVEAPALGEGQLGTTLEETSSYYTHANISDEYLDSETDRYTALVDCVVTLYNAITYDCGVRVTLCWFPTWRHKWGLSLKSL